MRKLIIMVPLLAGCGEQILQVGDDPAREDCRWTVTDSRPAIIRVEDLERCLGNIEFVIIGGPVG